MNQVRFCGSQAYASAPQSPYQQVFPGTAQAPPCAGASFGQPSVRAGWQRQRASPGGIGTPLHGVLRVHEHLPSGYTHARAPELTRSSQAPLAFANDAGHGAGAAQPGTAQIATPTTTTRPSPRAHRVNAQTSRVVEDPGGNR